MSQKKNNIYITHPWLNHHHNLLEEYINPDYYRQLLPEYIFNNKSDLEYLNMFFKKNQRIILDVLELGCGDGRATEAILKYHFRITAIDLNTQMLSSARKKFNNRQIEFIRSDIIEYLYNLKDKQFDLVTSLWGISYSIHRAFIKFGIQNGENYCKIALDNLFLNKLSQKGKFFFVHIDTKSEEQKFLMELWSKKFKIFQSGNMSPSELFLRKYLKELAENKTIYYEIQRLKGEPILYPSLEKALETYFNFHLHTFFNKDINIQKIFKKVENHLKENITPSGKIKIIPGCLIIQGEKLK